VSHLAYTLANMARAFIYGITGSMLAPSPVAGPKASYYRQMNRFSAATSSLADLALLTLGGALKRKESISGRFADAMAYLYLCSAVLKRFEDDGRPKGDLPLVQWACEFGLYQVQQALDGIIRNFPVRLVAWKMRTWALPLGCHLKPPSDRLNHQVASMLIEPSASRERLVAGIYQSEDEDDMIGRLHYAMKMSIRVESIERKLKKQGYSHRPDQSYEAWLQKLVEEQVLNQQEADLLQEAGQAVRKAVMVDDFPQDEWGHSPESTVREPG
jgi:acyl-CoA dehydrogenase